MPQRSFFVFIAAAISAVTLSGIGVVAHAADPGAGAVRRSESGSAAHFVPVSSSTRQRSAAATPSRHRLVDVAAANVWVGPHKPRPVDRPSLQVPVQLDQWLRHMSVGQRRGLTPRLATQIRYAEDVIVLRQHGPWSKVRIPSQTGGRFPNGVKGWVVSRQLAPRPPGWDQHPSVATVTALRAPVSWSANGAAQALTIGYATTLPVVAQSPDVVGVQLPGDAGIGTLPASSVVVHAVGTSAIAPSLAAIVAQAKRFLGLPYLWAGTSAWGFDCSGLTETVLGQLGVALPRDAADQTRIGQPVSRHRLQPGDLVFFSYQRQRSAIHHVAIYAGHGRVIESPFSGARVRISRLWHSSLAKEYWGATNPLA